jgi:hypothetical protein
MRKLYVILAAAAVVLTVTPVTQGATFTSVRQLWNRIVFTTELSSVNEVPGCPAGIQTGATGLATVSIGPAGDIRYRVVAAALPGPVVASHIHVGPAGVPGPVVQPLDLTGASEGVVAQGTAFNPGLAGAILFNPTNYYVNVHTTVCPAGAIRGQLL